MAIKSINLQWTVNLDCDEVRLFWGCVDELVDYWFSLIAIAGEQEHFNLSIYVFPLTLDLKFQSNLRAPTLSTFVLVACSKIKHLFFIYIR